jgi:hypothetical protein
MISGLKTVKNELETIREMFPPRPILTPEEQEFMAILDSLSDAEVTALSNMLMGIAPDPRILPPQAENEPRDCARCEFRLTGNAALLKHVPCNHLERGGFRPS